MTGIFLLPFFISLLSAFHMVVWMQSGSAIRTTITVFKESPFGFIFSKIYPLHFAIGSALMFAEGMTHGS